MRELLAHLHALLDDLEGRYENGRVHHGPNVPTGLRAFDADGGLSAGLWLVVGPALCGKSAFAHLAVLTASLHAGVRSTYVTLDGSGLDTVRRWLAALTRVPLVRVIGGDLVPAEWELVRLAVSALSRAPLELIEGAGMSLPEVGEAVASAGIGRSDRQLVVIDPIGGLPETPGTRDLLALQVSREATVLATAESVGSPSRARGAAGVLVLEDGPEGQVLRIGLDRHHAPGRQSAYRVAVRPGTCDLHEQRVDPASWGIRLPLGEPPP